MFNLNFLNGRKRFLENRIREICEMLPTLPEGQLSISIRKGRPYYYVCGLKDSEGRTTKKYITKDNESFAAALRRMPEDPQFDVRMQHQESRRKAFRHDGRSGLCAEESRQD